MARCRVCSRTGKDLAQENGMPRAGGIFLGLLFLLLCGCAATGTQGSLIRSDEVRKIFEGDTVLPDHVYYYSGPEAEPEAIIGIRQGLTFAGRYWDRVALTQEQLHSWNRRIDNAHRITGSYKGARIMTPDNRQAGIWYSKFDHTVLRFPDAQTIHIYAPGPRLRNDILSDTPEGFDRGTPR